MAAFDPTEHNFIRLQDFRLPGDVSVYEYKNHPAVDGTKDFLRLNLYLTLDGNYATVWVGLLEPLGTEAEFQNGRMASVAKPADFDFGSFDESLFKGYFDSKESAECILKALRVGESRRYAAPQVLTRGANNELRCDWIGEADQIAPHA
jgi:hypothetical protein